MDNDCKLNFLYNFYVFMLFWLVLFKLILAAQVTKSYLRRWPPIKIWGKSVQSRGSEVMVGQTNRDYNFIYIDFPAYPWYFNNDKLFLNIEKINSKICHKQLFKICRRLRFHLFKNYYWTFWSKNINSIAKDCNISISIQT